MSDQVNTADATIALSAEDRADLVNAIKNKLHDLTRDHSAFLDKFPKNIRMRVDVLRDIQRCEIVNGVGEAGDESTVGEETNESAGDKGIPHFWLLAMKNNEIIAKEITEKDEDALQYLKDIKWNRLDDANGFKLEFFFETNPYFSNNVLTKTYHMISEDEHILENAIGTEIEWFLGKCLTQKILKKKPKKGSNDTKLIIKTEECESFFHFFDPPQLPEDAEELDEETAELLQGQMEQDYEIGSTIREKIIPHAVSWFTGEADGSEETRGQ
uniref:Nucleosome assembly protein 1 n=1 Tax=Solanum lycopersicum TaxID=4081 RepID=A0A3Q7HQ62_SOLLC